MSWFLLFFLFYSRIITGAFIRFMLASLLHSGWRASAHLPAAVSTCFIVADTA